MTLVLMCCCTGCPIPSCSDGHGHQPLAVGSGDEPQRGLCGPGEAGGCWGSGADSISVLRQKCLHMHRLFQVFRFHSCAPDASPSSRANQPAWPSPSPPSAWSWTSSTPARASTGGGTRATASPPAQPRPTRRPLCSGVRWGGRRPVVRVFVAGVTALAAARDLLGASPDAPEAPVHLSSAHTQTHRHLRPHPCPPTAACPSGGRWTRRRRRCAPAPSPARTSRRSGPRTCTSRGWPTAAQSASPPLAHAARLAAWATPARLSLTPLVPACTRCRRGAAPRALIFRPLFFRPPSPIVPPLYRPADCSAAHICELTPSLAAIACACHSVP